MKNREDCPGCETALALLLRYPSTVCAECESVYYREEWAVARVAKWLRGRRSELESRIAELRRTGADIRDIDDLAAAARELAKAADALPSATLVD